MKRKSEFNEVEEYCVTYKDSQNNPQTKVVQFFNNDCTFAKQNHGCVQHDFEKQYTALEVVSVQFIRTL